MSSEREKLEFIARSKLLRRSITGVYCLRSAYHSSSNDPTATGPLRQSVGRQLWLVLNDGSKVAVLCHRATIDYGVSIKRENLDFSTDDDRYCRINHQSNWDAIRGKSIFEVSYHFREYSLLVSRKKQEGVRQIPVALEIEFTNSQKIWIVSMEIDSAGKANLGVDNMMIFFDQQEAEKYGFLAPYGTSHQDDPAVYEQFTWQGFVRVSTWAALYAFLLIQFLFLLVNNKVLVVESLWEASLLLYGAAWVLCFLLMCLWPKLRGRK